MADSASFLIALEEKISGPAKAGAASLADLDAKLKEDSKSLKILEGAMKRLESAGGGTSDQMANLRGQIDAKKQSIAGATDKIAGYKEQTEGAGEASGFFSEKIAAMGGPVGIAIAVVTALAAAIGVAVFAMAKLAIASSAAQARQLRLAEAMTGNKGAAKAMVDATYRVSSSVALAGDKVQALGGELMKAGLSGKTYESSLKNLANVATIAGDQAVGPLKEIIAKSQQLGHLKMEPDQLKGTGLQAKEVFQQLSQDLGIGIKDVEKRLKEGKISSEAGITALNKVMSKKFGALGNAALLDFDTQIAKAGENVGNLFKDVDTGPFLKGLQSLLGLLDQNTATGRALKGVLTGAMNGFFAAAGAVFPYVKAFLLGIGIAALRLYISLKPAIGALKEALGGGDSSTTDGLKTAADAGKILVGALVTIAAVGVAVFGALAAAVYYIVSPFIEVGAAAYGLYGSISGAMGEAVAYLSGLDFGAIASDLIDGLVSGIASGTGLVISAISGLGSSAIGALKSTLGIASPSKVFKGLGGFTAEGFAGGVDGGASKVEKSVNSLVALPNVSGLRPANDNAKKFGSERGGKGGGGGITVEAGGIQITIQAAGGDTADIEAAVERAVMKALDKIAAQQGAPMADEEAA